MPTELLTRIDWDLIYPPLRDKCFELAARCRDRGSRYFATYGYRDPAEQLALWQKGRDEDGKVVDVKKVVTKLKFGMHNLGLAVDWTFDTSDRRGLQPSWKRPEYDVLAEEAERLGLVAGHNWKGFPDSPHVELNIRPKHITISMLKSLYEKTGRLSTPWHLLDQNGPW